MARQRQTRVPARPVRRSARARQADARKLSTAPTVSASDAGGTTVLSKGPETSSSPKAQSDKTTTKVVRKADTSSEQSAGDDAMDAISDTEISDALESGAAQPAISTAGVHPDTSSLKPAHDKMTGSALAAERLLEEYDVDTRWGPSLGISRAQRYERARALNLDPPRDVGAVLAAHPSLNVHFPLQF